MDIKIRTMMCESCKKKTLHTESPVPVGETATMWHCLTCGTEQLPPDLDTDYRVPSRPKEPVSPVPEKFALKI